MILNPTVPATLKTHSFYIVLIVLGAFGFRAYLQEHDARIVAEQVVKASQTAIQGLQEQIKATDAAAAVQKQQIQAKVKAVATQQQAVSAVPDLSSLPLNTRPVPGDPTSVEVAWAPLIQQLGQCRQDAVDLTACKSDLTSEKGIVAQQDNEIKALKKKPGFWKALKHDAKLIAIGGAVGALLGLAHGGVL